MDTYQNKGCKLIPFTGNILNSFVLSEKGHRLTATELQSEQRNEDILRARMKNWWNIQRESVSQAIKISPRLNYFC